MPQINSSGPIGPVLSPVKTTSGMICGTCHTIYPPDEGAFCGKDGGPLQASDRVFAGKYVLEERLGFGQMGDVYGATQSGVGRKVALKILRADQADNTEMVKRFEREAQIASSLDHPNAVTIYESGRSAEGQAYIAMEYLVGETLGGMIEREGPLGLSRVLELLLPAVRAVASAHARNIVHRDLKPDNLFIARKTLESQEELVVKVLDFGIARVLGTGTRLTATHSKLGTPQYMSPEQLQGDEATPRSDVFAIALLLTEMLTGKLPWGETSNSSLSAMMARVVSPPRSLRQLHPKIECPGELQELLDSMLSQQPSRRPADAGVVLRRLQQIQAGLTQRVTPLPPESTRTPVNPLPNTTDQAGQATHSSPTMAPSPHYPPSGVYQHLPGVPSPPLGSMPLSPSGSGVISPFAGTSGSGVISPFTGTSGSGVISPFTGTSGTGVSPAPPQPVPPSPMRMGLGSSATTLPPQRFSVDTTYTRDPRTTRGLPRVWPRWVVPVLVMVGLTMAGGAWLLLGRPVPSALRTAGVKPKSPGVPGLRPSPPPPRPRPVALPTLLVPDPIPDDEPAPIGFTSVEVPPEPPLDEPSRRHRRHHRSHAKEETGESPKKQRHHRRRHKAEDEPEAT